MKTTTAPFRRDELDATLRPVEEASTLPRRAYTDPAVFEWELEHLFLGGWIVVGREEQVASPGQHFVRDVGRESLLLVRGQDEEVRGFYNVCRHRGARLVEAPEGTRRIFSCPYHAWSYGLDGTLRGAPHMDDAVGFDPACFGLAPVRTEIFEGMVFCDASGTAPPLAEHVGTVGEYLTRYRSGELQVARRVTYDVAANWKAIAENFSECGHCPGVHPELNALSHYLSGDKLTGEGTWCGGYMELRREEDRTMAVGGDREGHRPPIEGLTAEQARTINYFVLFPNAFVSCHPDYVMVHTLWPRAADRTEIVCEWHFEPATMARPDFDPSDAVDFWDLTNRQDWHVCEITQTGMGSRGYEAAGRYNAREGRVHAFDTLVAERYLGLAGVGAT